MKDNENKIGFLFDLDGVIIDTEREYTKIWATINKEFPTGIDNFEYIIKGTTLSKILSEYYSDENIKRGVKNRLHQLEKEMQFNYLPNVEDFLKELKARNYPAALVTSSDNKKMSYLWEQLPELKDYFNYIVTGDQVKTSKPSPEGYMLAASKIKVPCNNCAVFEDSLQGVMAGNNAGALVVGVTGTLPRQSLAPYSHLLIDDFSQLNLDSLILKLKSR